MTLIFFCQLVGEAVVGWLHLPLPGPVVGMALLLAGLIVHGRLPSDLGAVADVFTGNLSLLFVPAGVGVMQHVGLLGRDWLPILVALVVGTALTIAVTALAMARLNRSSLAARSGGVRSKGGE